MVISRLSRAVAIHVVTVGEPDTAKQAVQVLCPQVSQDHVQHFLTAKLRHLLLLLFALLILLVTFNSRLLRPEPDVSRLRYVLTLVHLPTDLLSAVQVRFCPPSQMLRPHLA